ncbi:MAG: type I secretion system permease/ATPase [Hyphomicrobiales bacterium]|nr:type I secretion system permease/ATPase [Hyphomicrobiales bacterium]
MIEDQIALLHKQSDGVPTRPSETAKRQHGEKSIPHSGAVCLAIVMQLNKIAADPRQIMRENAPDGDFCIMTLVRAAKRLGIRARMTKSSVKRLHKIPLPSIIELHDGEFMILARVGQDEVLVQRPDEPPVRLSFDDLTDIWTGGIVFVTTRATLASGEVLFGLSWFASVVGKYRRLIGEVLLASFFLQLLGLVTPIFFQVVVDKVLVHRGMTTLDVLAIGLLAISIAEVLLGGLRTYVFSHTSSRIDVELGAKLFDHMINLPLRYFESRPVGQTIARLRELENIRDFLTGSAVTVLIDSMFTVVFFAVMYMYSPTLFWISFLSVPCFVVVSAAVTPGLRVRLEEQFQRGAINQSFLTETVSGVETVKSMAVESTMRKRWEEQLAGYVRAGFRAVIFGAVGGQLVQLIMKIVTLAILWKGAILVINGELSVGQLVAFNMLAGQVSGPIIRLSQLWQDFQQMRISVARIGDVLNSPVEPGHNANRASLPNIVGAISFDRVSFRYDTRRPEVLRDVSLNIRQGEVVGLVGGSGSGKSTLTKLVQRLYVQERGRILIDGVDISTADTLWLRRQIGVVLQESVMFRGTVRDNIAMSDPSMPVERVHQAARVAGAHEFILEMSEGYDTLLEERGGNLSGGQRQRVAIARAIAANPPILIFDEATSALDYESERVIQNNMKQICANRTVLIVTHRLSTVRHADRIIVMDRGAIVESGTHEDLLTLNGTYANLCGH